MLNTKFNLYNAGWLDVVFAGRNKNYGAYDLRLHYSETIFKALAITVLGFGLVAGSLSLYFKLNKPEETTTTIVDLTQDRIVLPPEKETPVEAKIKKQPPASKLLKQAAAAPKANIAMQHVVPPVVAPDDMVKRDIVPIDPNKAIGPVDAQGDLNKPAVNAPEPVGTGGDGKSTGEPKASNEPVEPGTLDAMPEPYGGAAAWSRFLQKNLRYPETEAQGRVIISFIIERDGRLTDLQVVRGVVSELDREALRVLKLAPAWKPGLQAGKPVRVKYTIPIVFQMQE
jgi:periplasmic protein TonB